MNSRVDEWQNQKLYAMEQAIMKIARRSGVQVDLDCFDDDDNAISFRDADQDGIPDAWQHTVASASTGGQDYAAMASALSNLINAVTMLNLHLARSTAANKPVIDAKPNSISDTARIKQLEDDLRMLKGKYQTLRGRYQAVLNARTVRPKAKATSSYDPYA